MSSEYHDLRLPTVSQIAAAKQARREARAAKRQAKLQRELERQSYAVVNAARKLSGSVGSHMRRLSGLFLTPRDTATIVDVAPSEDESTPRPSSRILSTWKPNLTTHQRRQKTEMDESESSETDDEDTPRIKRKPTSPRHSIPSRMKYLIFIIITLFVITLYLGMSNTSNEDDEMSAMQRWTHSVIKMTTGSKNATVFSIPSPKSSSPPSAALSVERSIPTPRTRARWIPPSTPAAFAPKYPLPAPSWPTPPAKMCTGSLIFRTWALLSPNGKLDVVIEWTRPTVQDGYRAVGLWLTMYHEKRRILKPSRLELDVEDLIDVTPDSEGQHYDMSQSLLHHQQTSTSDTWHPTIPHERRSYTMRCNILILVFKKQHSEKTKSTHAHKLKKEYTFRACDTGFAWRSTLHDIDDTIRPSTERHEMIHATTLRWNGDTSTIRVWGSIGDEPYRMYALNDTIPLLPVPLTLHIPSPDLYITLAQSGGLSFTTTTTNSMSSGTLYMHTSGSITNLPISTPWHVMIIATTPIGLYDNNRMIPMLNDESQLEDKTLYKWLRPGHNIRISSFTTHEVEQWLEWVYKHQSHITMIQLPEGWYGDTSGPQHAISVDPSHALSLDDVVASAQAQSVSIQVYVTDIAMNTDDLPRIYYDYHITSIMVDVVNEMNTAEISSFHHHMITFGQKHIMFDTHTPHYRPRGLHRTYPHMIGHGTSMSGSSHPSADDNVMMPFITGIQGPVQYQYRFRDPNNKVTIAHLLALNIILFTPFPLHTDTFSVATNDAWFTFAMSIPTIWSDTRIVSMLLGEYVSIARLDVEQHTWYIGTITNNDTREIELDLSFLDANVKEWEIHGWTDDDKPVNRVSQQGVRVISMTLTHNSLKLSLHLRGSGGHVIAITPKS